MPDLGIMGMYSSSGFAEESDAKHSSPVRNRLKGKLVGSLPPFNMSNARQ
jgi:hypothetical protein